MGKPKVSPLVSVVMPTYNSINTVERSIESVLCQTMQDLELIVIDDGSQDNTLELINRIAKEDQRVHIYINNENKGVAITRNLGVSYAKGMYIAFIDSDDLWVVDKLAIQIDCINKTKADFCYSSYEFININGEKVGNLYKVQSIVSYKQLLGENVIGCSTVLIKKGILPENPFSSKYFHEDYVLWLKLLKAQKCAVGINESLVKYRVGGRSSNKIKAALYRWEIYRKEEKLSFLSAGYYMSKYFISGLKKRIK